MSLFCLGVAEQKEEQRALTSRFEEGRVFKVSAAVLGNAGSGGILSSENPCPPNLRGGDPNLPQI